MNTYLVYALNTTTALEPTVTLLYVRAEKYGPAWQTARASLSGKAPALFADPECSAKTTVGHGDHLTVAKIVDIRPRNVKLDKTALQAILADPKAKPEDKIAAMKAILA